MNQQDKDNLSYLYETDQYKSFKKLCGQIQKNVLTKLMQKDASDVGGIAILQGQYYALDTLLKKIEEIHKASMKE